MIHKFPPRCFYRHRTTPRKQPPLLTKIIWNSQGGEFLWLMDFWVCGNFFGGDVLFIFYLNICSSHLLPTSLGDLTSECSALEFTVNHSNPCCIHTQFYSWANNLSRNIFKRLHICSLPMELNLVGMSIPGCNKLKQKSLRHRNWVQTPVFHCSKQSLLHCDYTASRACSALWAQGFSFIATEIQV